VGDEILKGSRMLQSTKGGVVAVGLMTALSLMALGVILL
jgi:hypothetical protein